MNGKLTFPTEYEELRGKRGWFAKQTDSFTGLIRKSVERYESREDLVAALAFGKHQWDKWHDGKTEGYTRAVLPGKSKAKSGKRR